MDNALSGGLQGRGIHLNSASDTTWGLYLHNDVSLNGSTAVNGDGFTSTSTRLRVPNNANNGLILENANERRLLSVRGNDGFTSINGELRVVESATFNSTVLFDDDTTHHGKIIVMDNALSGGLKGRGIHLNSAADTTWGLYLHSDVSLNGSSAVNGDGFFSTSARLRVPNNANNGFVWGDANERRLLSVRGNDGYTSINGTCKATDFTGDGRDVTNLDMNNATLGILDVNRGGTGTGYLSDNALLVGNGSGSIQSPIELYWDSGNNRLGIGSVSPSSKLYVDGDIRASQNVIAESDRRLKTNLRTIEGAAVKVARMRGYVYNRVDLPPDMAEDRDRDYMGMIAQEVLKIAPEVVYHDKQADKYGISYGNLVALLIEAINEKNAEFEERLSRLERASSLS